MVEKEPEGCKVYGVSPGGEEVGLTPWHHAIRPCLEGLSIENLTMSQAELYDFCPNATINNETGRVDQVNIDTFVNLVKNEPTRQEALEIMALFEDRMYFVKQEGENGTTYGLNETFMNPQGVLNNCTATPSFCWNDIKTDMRGRELRLLNVCTAWHDTRKKLLNSEQRKARIRICNQLDSGEEFPEDCEDLVEQIKAQKAAFPDAECDAFGKGAGQNLTLPTCEEGEGGVDAKGTSSGGHSITAQQHGGSTTVIITVMSTALLASVSSLMLLG
jgi:hypothetical protein